jgi:regulator of replication initiation timing
MKTTLAILLFAAIVINVLQWLFAKSNKNIAEKDIAELKEGLRLANMQIDDSEGAVTALKIENRELREENEDLNGRVTRYEFLEQDAIRSTVKKDKF